VLDQIIWRGELNQYVIIKSLWIIEVYQNNWLDKSQYSCQNR